MVQALKIGNHYLSNNCGEVKILSKSNKPYRYLVKFLNTGTEKEFREDCIKDGCIRDPYAKLMCGVACTGNIKTKGSMSPYYSIWHDMINRCYNVNDKQHSAYKNVTVSPEWLIFENFYNDIANIPNFNDNKIRNGELVLDKDLKQRGFQTKVYSKETCVWLPPSENALMQDGQQKLFSAISPDGTTYESRNITEFARQHNLERRHISGVLHGRCKTTQGWKVSYIEEIV